MKTQLLVPPKERGRESGRERVGERERERDRDTRLATAKNTACGATSYIIQPPPRCHHKAAVVVHTHTHNTHTQTHSRSQHFYLSRGHNLQSNKLRFVQEWVGKLSEWMSRLVTPTVSQLRGNSSNNNNIDNDNNNGITLNWPRRCHYFASASGSRLELGSAQVKDNFKVHLYFSTH